MRRVKVRKHIRKKSGRLVRVKSHGRNVKSKARSNALELRRIHRSSIALDKGTKVNIDEFIRRDGDITTAIQGRGRNAPDIVPLSGELSKLFDVEKVNAESVTLKVGEPMKSLLEKNMPRQGERISGIKHDTLELLEDYLKRRAFRKVDADMIKQEARYNDGVLKLPTLADRSSDVVAKKTQQLQRELGQKAAKMSYIRDVLKDQKKEMVYDDAAGTLIREFKNRYDRVPLTPDDFKLMKDWTEDKKILGSTLFPHGVTDEDLEDLNKYTVKIQDDLEKVRKKIMGNGLGGALNMKVSALLEQAGGNKLRALEYVKPDRSYHLTRELGIRTNEKSRIGDAIKRLIELEKAAEEETKPRSHFHGAPLPPGSNVSLTPSANMIRNTVQDMKSRKVDDPIRREQKKLLERTFAKQNIRILTNPRNPSDIQVSFKPRKKQ